MDKSGNIDASDILGITEQQLNLLKTVYKLSSKNKQATPREIEITYGKDKSGEIQKSNLFRQLKILIDKEFLTRDGEANYRLNFDGLKRTIDQRKLEFQERLVNYERLANQLEEYFKKATERPEVPQVEYIHGDKELFTQVTQSLKKASSYYVTAKFPALAYTFTPYMKTGRGEYLQTLIYRCFEKKDLEITYLSPLDLDYPYMHSLNLFQDKNKAIKECEAIINQLENTIEVFDNFHLYYLKNPYGLDVLIPEGGSLTECYSFIRDINMNAIGGIYMKSEQIARQTKETFQALCQSATEAKGASGRQICADLRERLASMGEVTYGKVVQDKE